MNVLISGRWLDVIPVLAISRKDAWHHCLGQNERCCDITRSGSIVLFRNYSTTITAFSRPKLPAGL